MCSNLIISQVLKIIWTSNQNQKIANIIVYNFHVYQKVQIKIEICENDARARNRGSCHWAARLASNVTRHGEQFQWLLATNSPPDRLARMTVCRKFCFREKSIFTPKSQFLTSQYPN
ncbi:hypothetical protein MTR_2g018655 [Medicago truncatula]|uniref:Uncharacterized protein n=1 Tax=Medicago truncatula TaxID=3880 RepID=A0A072V5Q2_MEDTR|nr:hypothetical protein MTR_2g018655 [Medicago truncatula]